MLQENYVKNLSTTLLIILLKICKLIVPDKIDECSVVVLLSWYGFTQWPRDFADKISTACGDNFCCLKYSLES